MRFVLVSTHTDQTTGYSKVAYNLLKQLATLAPRVKTYHFGFQRHPAHSNIRKPIEGIVQYDAAANEDPKEEGFGFNKIHEYLEMVNPDVVMIYNDPLIIYKFIESMKYDKTKSPYKLWVYVDQVYDGIAQPLIDKINQSAERVFCFTEEWKAKYLGYGPAPKVYTLGHAVDPNVFTNMTSDAKSAVRRSLNIPPNATVFLNANRNSQRKRLDLSIGGFVRLLKKRPTEQLFLMMVTTLNPQAGAYYDLQRVFIMELVANGLDPQTYIPRLLLVDTAPPNAIDDGAINQLYNACDIGVNTSDGEGFGLCQLEHMYTGAPQIVTDVGSYRSFLDDKVAEFIPPSDRIYQAGNMVLGAYAPGFTMESVAHAMDHMLQTLDVRRAAVSLYNFKSWASVCDGLLEDILTYTSYQVTNVSVLAPSEIQP